MRALALLLLSLVPASLALEIDREYGSSSFKFLKLPLSPRIVGLAGAGSALADGAGEIDLNPAASMFCDTPRNGHRPRNRTNTKLLTRTVPTRMTISSDMAESYCN
jgi:hypothetical protein